MTVIDLFGGSGFLNLEMWNFIIEHKKLLVDFFLAVVSGTAAGLAAGVILLWRQFGMELAKDDVKCILDILHMIDGAQIEVSDAFWNVRFAEQDDEDTKELEQILTDKTAEAMDVFAKIAKQAQYIRAKKYRLVRGYVVLRAKRGINFDWDEIETMGNLEDFAKDIRELATERRILNWLKWRWRLAYDFTEEQRTMLANATTSGNPRHWWILWRVNPKKLSSVETERGINRVRDLVGRGLLSECNDKYELTRTGWKVAARVLKGRYDRHAGVMIN
jgi:hypothetical protein